MKTKKLTLMAMLLAIALIIFTLEAQLPPLVPIPGVKIGLANIITLISIYLIGRKEAFAILILRIVLGSVFSGNGIGFIYSVSGALLAFAAMGVLSAFLKEDKIWVVSVFGAIAHNIGQIAAACFMVKSAQILWYLPLLTISAVITGMFTGIAAQIVLKRLRKERNNA